MKASLLTKFLLTGILVFVMSGCAYQRISNSKWASNVPDSEAVLISVPWDGQLANHSWAQIKNLDYENFSAWHVKVGPGLHSITLMQMGSHAMREFTIDAKAGKRYDLTFEGKGWESARNPVDDEKFFGPNNPLETTALVTNSSGKFVELSAVQAIEQARQREQQIRRDAQVAAQKAWARSPEGQRQIKIDQKRRADDDAAKRDEANREKLLVSKVGQKICKVIHGTERQIRAVTYDGRTLYGPSIIRKYSITAFTESVSGPKIQLRIAGIQKEIDLSYENVDRIDGDAVIQPNSVLWEDSGLWHSCN